MNTDELAENAIEFGRVANDLLAAKLPERTDVPVRELTARHALVWRELAALGWADVLASQTEGGLGLSPAVLGETFKAIGRHLAPGPLTANVFAVPWLLRHAGGNAPGLQAAHAARAPFALVDAEVGGWSRRGRSVVLVDGALTGTVVAVPNAAIAEHLLVVTRKGDSEWAVLIPSGRQGVEVTACEGIDPCETFATVELTGCPVADEDVVAADPGLVRQLRAWMRVLIACELSGVVEHVLEMSTDYAKHRRQFGRPIGANQAVKHLLADIACDAATLGNLTALTLREADRSAPGDLEHSAIVLKSHAARTGIRACERALQAHGGIGFTAEYGLHWYFKRALTLAGRYGTPSELDLMLGQTALGHRPRT